MKRLVLTCAALAGVAAPAFADEPGIAAIPLAYQGRWTNRPADCHRPPSIETNIITISARGWSAWEEGGTVIRVGQTRGTTRYFLMRNYAGPSESEGSVALRLQGGRLYMSFNEPDGTPANYVMSRCPRA